MRHLPLLLLLAASLAAGGCVRLSDGTLAISSPASSERVGEVEDALLTEQAERQEGDKALRSELSATADALKAGLDPAPILAQAKKDAETSDAAQAARLKGEISAARDAEVPWLEILLGAAGVTGAGVYGTNRYRNSTRKKDLALTAATGKAPVAA